MELSETNGKLLWVPPGFAHGFCVLGDEDASVIYKVDGVYSAAGEGGICYDDPDLKIEWPILTRDKNISAKDRVLPTFAEYKSKPVFK